MNNIFNASELDNSGNANWKTMLLFLTASTSVAICNVNVCPQNTSNIIYSNSSIASTKQNNFVYTTNDSYINTNTNSNVISEKLLEFIKTAHNVNHSRDELFKLYDFLYNIIKMNDLSAYKIIFDRLDISSISIGLIVGLLRTSFMYKYKIDNWNMFLEKSKKEILSRDPSKHKLLSGLM